ncbi:hypothetical protein [Streptosporangium carneum]|uniref:Uncharacterized protein n=1 Tax=Streptosporangium carneum TaxID=47481 RepID=A0A9W6IAM6_9ACTN|nr:hypothetical protein [Streptosporangium carneum]GLK13940.1 hypothetical protein GCM10017600_73520 [Streptosporangium carneum]
MSLMPHLPLPSPWRGTTIRIIVWVLVMAFVVTLTSLGSDPALALGVALAALTATIGDLLQTPVPSLPGR